MGLNKISFINAIKQKLLSNILTHFRWSNVNLKQNFKGDLGLKWAMMTVSLF